jgi:predicted phage terminase large subunit-like protein
MLADREDDPLGREIGAPLWPQWFGQHQIEQNIRNPLRWSALFQQVPLDDSGSWVSGDHIQLVEPSKVPEKLNIVIAMDLALSTGRGDYTVFVVAGLDADRDLYIIDVERHRYTPDNAVKVLFRLCDEYQPSDVLIDDDPAAKVFFRLFLELARRRGVGVPMSPMPLRGQDKETRASAIRGMFLMRNVYITNAAWTSDLIGEIYDFPHGDHDDQIDCLGLIGRRVPQMSTPSLPSGQQLIRTIVFQDDGKFFIQSNLNELFDDREKDIRAISALRRRL